MGQTVVFGYALLGTTSDLKLPSRESVATSISESNGVRAVTCGFADKVDEPRRSAIEEYCRNYDPATEPMPEYIRLLAAWTAEDATAQRIQPRGDGIKVGAALDNWEEQPRYRELVEALRAEQSNPLFTAWALQFSSALSHGTIGSDPAVLSALLSEGRREYQGLWSNYVQASAPGLIARCFVSFLWEAGCNTKPANRLLGWEPWMDGDLSVAGVLTPKRGP